MHSTRIEMAGRRYGRLTVLHADPNRRPHHVLRWLCRCDCGTETWVRGPHLRNGATQSCGCMRDEQTRIRNRRHGLSHTPAYQSWHDAKRRCHDPNDPAYPSYGGRGIRMCDEWRRDVTAFYRDMGDQPPGCTLERVDNDRGYEPDNCVWATRWQQAQNTRIAKRFTVGELTLTRAQWAQRLGLTAAAIRRRIRVGWSIERALTEPRH